MIFSTKRLSTTQLEDLRFPWETITPLCRNCIPWQGGERLDLVVSPLHGNGGDPPVGTGCLVVTDSLP